MNRREFMIHLGALVALVPCGAHAEQSGRVRRVGVVMGIAERDPDAAARISAFHQVLEKRGWSVGRNLHIDYRWSGGDLDGTRAAAIEIVSLAPEIILADGTAALRAVRQAAGTTPIVFTVVSEPVAAGFV